MVRYHPFCCVVVNTKWIRLTRYELLYEEITNHQILASFYICHLGGALYLIICFYTRIGKYKDLSKLLLYLAIGRRNKGKYFFLYQNRKV